MISLTRDQVREVDRLAIEKYHIPGIVLMENAHAERAKIAADMLAHPNRSKSSSAAAMATTAVTDWPSPGIPQPRLSCPPRFHHPKFTGDALVNWRIIAAMQLPFTFTRKHSRQSHTPI